MALDATPAGPNANSYCTVAEADAYNSTRPFATSWLALDVPSKEGALQFATLLLDSTFRWTGNSTSYTDQTIDPPQALCWPRTGMVTRSNLPLDPMTIPIELKYAEAEFARQLTAADRTADNDAAKQGIMAVTAGSVNVRFQKLFDDPKAQLAYQNSRFTYLNRMVPDLVRFLLVPSWYTEQVTININSDYWIEAHR